MTRHTILLILAFVVCLSGCKKSAKIYFVPIGQIPASTMNDLVSHYHAKFGVPTEVLPPVKVNEWDTDGSRRQLIAENVLQEMIHTYSDYRTNPSDVLIGVTAQDMYPKSEGWEFCFSWRSADDRAAVVSTGRMALHYIGEPIDEATPEKRMFKMITKNIGILYYQKPPSDNPRSVLYSNIMGIQELDQVTENF